MAQYSLTETWQKHLPLEIPPLWQVIYYEGIHGHHILFSPDDLKTFESYQQKGPGIPVRINKQVSETGFRLLKSRSFRDMVELIDGLDQTGRRQIFRLYRNWLAEIQCRIKETAH